MQQAPTRRRWLRSKWTIGTGILLLLALPLLALVAWDYLSLQWADKELARLQAAGSPVTADDLETFYALPAGADDVTRLWLSASDPLETKAFSGAAVTLPIVGEGEAEIPPPGEPWPQLEEARRLLLNYQEQLSQLHEAAARGGAARYPTQFSAGFEMLLPHVQPLRVAARLLALEAHVKAHDGDAQGAARSIHAIFKVAGSLEREPVLVSQLVRFTMDGVGREALESLLPHTAFADKDLLILQTDLLAVDYETAIVRALQGDRVTCLAVFRDPRVMGKEASVFLWRMTRGQDLQMYLTQMDHSIEAASLPTPASRAALDDLERQLKTAKSSVVKRLGHHLSLQLLNGVNAASASFRGTAFNRAAATALAVERHRRIHGALPKSLQDLPPSLLSPIPTDPFDGKPLRYAIRGDGFVVYSVGEDGKDDGGEEDHSGKPDAVFTVKRGLRK